MRDVVAAAAVTIALLLLIVAVPSLREKPALLFGGANTAVVFGLLIKWTRSLWKRRELWFVLFGLLMAHLAFYFWLLSSGSKIPGAAFVVLDLVECGLALAVVNWILNKGESTGKIH